MKAGCSFSHSSFLQYQNSSSGGDDHDNDNECWVWKCRIVVYVWNNQNVLYHAYRYFLFAFGPAVLQPSKTTVCLHLEFEWTKNRLCDIMSQAFPSLEHDITQGEQACTLALHVCDPCCVDSCLMHIVLTLDQCGQMFARCGSGSQTYPCPCSHHSMHACGAAVHAHKLCTSPGT